MNKRKSVVQLPKKQKIAKTEEEKESKSLLEVTEKFQKSLSEILSRLDCIHNTTSSILMMSPEAEIKVQNDSDEEYDYDNDLEFSDDDDRGKWETKRDNINLYIAEVKESVQKHEHEQEDLVDSLAQAHKDVHNLRIYLKKLQREFDL